MTDSPDITAQIRRVAEVNFSAQLEVRNRLMDESSAASRWVLATLVTVNSGAAFATFTSDAVTRPGKLTGAALFCVGIFWAVMLGYATILAANKVMPKVLASADFWMDCILREEIDSEAMTARQSAVQSAAKPWKIASHVFGWLSLMSFTMGVGIVGCYLK